MYAHFMPEIAAGRCEQRIAQAAAARQAAELRASQRKERRRIVPFRVRLRPHLALRLRTA